MATFTFSALSNAAHLSFDPQVDVLVFDATTISASEVRLAVSGDSLSITVAGKTIWLDGVSPVLLALENFEFADGSVLLLGDGTGDGFHDAYGAHYTLTDLGTGNQVWGRDGADLVTTGSGADWIVGNVALAPLNHVSRAGATGSPNASTLPTVSADGRFVAFAGGWTQFGSSSNSAADVLVKDMVSGSVGNEHVDASGTPGLSGSGSPVISADGRWLVFNSSSGLVPGTPPSNTLYIAAVGGSDIQAISTTTGNAAYADRGAYLPDVSGSGRYVVYSSDATNLAAGSTSATIDVFLKDVATGSVTRVSTSTSGGDGNGDSGYLGNAAYTGAKISADGDYVVFQSAASNLTSGDTNGRTDIFLYTVATGQLVNLTKDLAVVSNPNNGNVKADVAYNGDDNAIVVFETARNLVAADTSNGTDVYALNFKTGELTLVSSRADGSGVALSSGDASVSDDGRWVTFTSYSDDLVAGDSNGTRDIFVKDLYTGAIALVSRAGAVAGNGPSSHAQISSGGDWIVFESSASNLAATDANTGFSDVFRVANPLLKDTLIGGAGNDTYVLSRADVVSEAAGGGTDTVQASIHYTLGANLENLVLTGTANLNGTGNSLNNVITGNAGNNVLNGAAGIDTVSYANATAAVTVNLATTTAQATGFGSDTLLNFENVTGSRFNDRLTGNGLANRLDGGLGNDTLTGAAGNDTYIVESAGDIIVEAANAGTDTVVSAVNWTLGATLENLTLTGTTATLGNGNSANNLLSGNSANNRMSAGAGNDTVSGGAGNDSLVGGAGNDTLNGGTGNDTLAGGEGSDVYHTDSSADVVTESGTTAGDIDTVLAGVSWTLGSTLERLTLTGTATSGGGNQQANVLAGNAVANTLSGAAGNDTVSGGAGNDTLRGDAGADALTGGAGNDVFVFNSRVGSDTIGDFLAGTDDVRISQGALRIGDGDLLVEGAVRVGSTGGFSNSAELVIHTNNATSLSTSAAAAAIGSATAAYTIGRTALFAVDNGTSTGVYLFTAADANAQVSASELTLLATLTGTTTTTSADYLFSA
jgi:Ca2+-binding RTX toxin-like protein